MEIYSVHAIRVPYRILTVLTVFDRNYSYAGRRPTQRRNICHQCRMICK